jgi:hypothetical protein
MGSGNAARFVLTRSRVLRDIRVAGKTPELTPIPTATTWSAAIRGELGSRHCVRIMSPSMVNEL